MGYLYKSISGAPINIKNYVITGSGVLFSEPIEDLDRYLGTLLSRYDDDTLVSTDPELPLSSFYSTVLSAYGITEHTRLSLQNSGIAGNTTTTGISGASLGLVPDTGADLTAKFQAALTTAREQNKPIILLPGKYLYSDQITNAGGGLICETGQAWLENTSPNYDNVVFNFNSTDSSYLNGLEVRGIKFTVATRPDTGLSNGAPEYAGFIRVTKARNVKIWGNEFRHGWGGCVLFRDVEDSSIIGNLAVDMWKDCFHVTDACRGILRAFNVVKGAGDDAFAVVGYIAKGVYPIGIIDIGNRVYGVRKARAFAYVGCRDVENTNSYVEGRIPVEIPQQSDVGGGRYNTACALYIAAESGFNSYGCENIKITGFVGENIAPGIDAAGNPVLTYQQIHISASNGAGSPLKNINVEAKLRNGATRGLFVVGNGYLEGLTADVQVEDNTDPLGLLSLTSTPGTGNQNAAEFQNVRNIKLKLRANKIAKGGVWCDSNCSGYGDIDVSIGSISQTTAAQNPITISTNTKFEVIDLKLNVETTPTASGLGSWNRIIDNPNQGVTRSVRITGVDHGVAAANVLNGWPTRTLTLGASPSSVVNNTGRPLMFYSRLGTVSAIARSGIRGRAIAKAVTTGANGIVQVDGDFTDIYTAATVVSLFNGRGVQIASGTVASSSVSGGVTTITFDATGVNASFAVGMQLGVVGTPRTLPSRTSGVIELPPETVVQVTYSAAPTCAITDMSF